MKYTGEVVVGETNQALGNFSLGIYVGKVYGKQSGTLMVIFSKVRDIYLQGLEVPNLPMCDATYDLTYFTIKTWELD